MSHLHHNHHQKKGQNLLISILLNVIISTAQVVGGLISGSLSLLSDAVHNTSDVISLLLSYIATKLSQRKASLSKTFGYKRAELLAAFINAITLIVVAVLLIFEAINRFKNPQEINSKLVIWLAFIAILVNGFSVLLLKKDAKNNLNMRSAYLHLFTDMLASIAVLVGGVLMTLYKVFWVDSLLTLLIAIYLIWISYDLLIKSTKMLMLFTPEDINIKDVVKKVNTIKGVKALHHVHVWCLNDDELHLEAHLDLEKNITIKDFDTILKKIKDTLSKTFKINHVTIQPEFNKKEKKNIIIQD